jgi:hypothetical protein
MAVALHSSRAIDHDPCDVAVIILAIVPAASNCTAVFDLVAWWTTEKRAFERARKALRLRNIWPSDHEPSDAFLWTLACKNVAVPRPSGANVC